MDGSPLLAPGHEPVDTLPDFPHRHASLGCRAGVGTRDRLPALCVEESRLPVGLQRTGCGGGGQLSVRLGSTPMKMQPPPSLVWA